MNPVDQKYVGVVSGMLERFVVKSNNPYRANLRCPICGDSKKSKYKARGWLLERDHQMTVFYCHNCNASMSFGNFIKHVYPSIHKEYTNEKALDAFGPKKRTKAYPKQFNNQPVRKQKDPLSKISKISRLNVNHPARRYIDYRKIPTNKHYLLYYAPKFIEWTKDIGVATESMQDAQEHPRIVLPFFDRRHRMFGLTGRNLDKGGLRYLTLMIDDVPKIYGLDRVDWNRTYNVVEGPIDSLFLDNAIAMAGADFSVRSLQNKSNAVVIYDNEPRNEAIVKKMQSAIEKGLSICIWPKSLPYKDINDMAMANIRYDLIIQQNTHSGLMADTLLKQWRKV